MNRLHYSLIILSIGAVTLLILLRPRGESTPPPPAQPANVEQDLSDKEIKAIVDEQRAQRTDLPAPFPDYEWVARRDGSHYTYMEYGLPKSPGYNQIFKLNRAGVIVDAYSPENPLKTINCPEKVYSAEELAAIVKKEREKRNDLPPEFRSFKTRVDRMRCLYIYFEYQLPDTAGVHHAFVIDPYGELMEVFPAG